MEPDRLSDLAVRRLLRHRVRVFATLGLASAAVGGLSSACSSSTPGHASSGAGLLVAPMQATPENDASAPDGGADGALVFRPFPREPSEPRGRSCEREVDCNPPGDEAPPWPYAAPFSKCAIDGDSGGVFSEHESRKARHDDETVCCYVSFACDTGHRAPPKHVIIRGRPLPGGPAVTETGLRAMLAAEHFSVLAFRALARDLALHAAPAELVTAAWDAAEDEAAHVVAARGLLARAGEDGTLDERGATLPAPATFAELVRAAFVDGCTAEGALALQLDVAAEARGPGSEEGAILAAIAADEARHADLGFRTLRWALAARPAEARLALRDAIATVARDGAPADDLFLDASTARALASAWTRDVVLPAATMLVDALH
jgi:hypothetical protein